MGNYSDTAIQPAVLEGLHSGQYEYQYLDWLSSKELTHVTINEDRNGGPYSNTKRFVINSAISALALVLNIFETDSPKITVK